MSIYEFGGVTGTFLISLSTQPLNRNEFNIHYTSYKLGYLFPLFATFGIVVTILLVGSIPVVPY